MCTLIGTSTNLLVDGAAQSAGLEPFTLFEVTPLGVILAAYGILYLRLAGPHLLPTRESLGSLLRDRQQMKFFTEVVLPKGSALAGQNAFEVDLFRRRGVRIINVLRGERPLRDSFPDVVLQEEDRVVLRTDATEVLGLHESREVLLADKISSRESKTVETLVSPRSKMVGKTVGSLRLVQNFGIYLLAIHRPKGRGAMGKLDKVRLRVGDTLLMEGVPADINKFAVHYDVTEIENPTPGRSGARKRQSHCWRWLRWCCLPPLESCQSTLWGFIAVAVVLVTGCIDAEEGLSFIDGRLMTLIFAMLAIGAAMESSGAITLIANSDLAAVPGPASDPIGLVCLFAHIGVDRNGLQQCRRGGHDAGCGRSGRGSGCRPETACGCRDGCRFGQFRDTHRLPNQHARVWTRRLQFCRLHQDRTAFEYLSGHPGQFADPVFLAALAACFLDADSEASGDHFRASSRTWGCLPFGTAGHHSRYPLKKLEDGKLWSGPG